MEDYGRSDLFRYGVISPLLQRFLSGDKISLKDFEELAEKTILCLRVISLVHIR